MELDHKDGAGDGFDCPEGADDFADVCIHEGADDADVFGGDGLVGGDRCFAGAEAGEVVGAKV